jgi:hypothetical protein
MTEAAAPLVRQSPASWCRVGTDGLTAPRPVSLGLCRLGRSPLSLAPRAPRHDGDPSKVIDELFSALHSRSLSRPYNLHFADQMAVSKGLGKEP